MPKRITCQCGRVVIVPDGFKQEAIRCPNCQTTVHLHGRQPSNPSSAGRGASGQASSSPTAEGRQTKPAAGKKPRGKPRKPTLRAKALPTAPAPKPAPKPAAKTEQQQPDIVFTDTAAQKPSDIVFIEKGQQAPPAGTAGTATPQKKPAAPKPAAQVATQQVATQQIPIVAPAKSAATPSSGPPVVSPASVSPASVSPASVSPAPPTAPSVKQATTAAPRKQSPPVAPPSSPPGVPARPAAPPPPEEDEGEPYLVDSSKRATSYWISLGLFAVTVFSLVPAIIQLVDVVQSKDGLETPRWVYLLLFAGLLQSAYAIYLAQLPDWSSAWVVTLVTLVAGTFYAMMMAVCMLASNNNGFLAGLQLSREAFTKGQQVGWCLIMLLANILLGYVAGRFAIRWRLVLKRTGL